MKVDAIFSHEKLQQLADGKSVARVVLNLREPDAFVVLHLTNRDEIHIYPNGESFWVDYIVDNTTCRENLEIILYPPTPNGNAGGGDFSRAEQQPETTGGGG
jgi:hypothetical protein